MKSKRLFFLTGLFLLFNIISSNSLASETKNPQAPIIATTCGQSPGALMVKLIAKRAKLECSQENELKPSDLKNGMYKTLIITMGTSLNRWPLSLYLIQTVILACLCNDNLIVILAARASINKTWIQRREKHLVSDIPYSTIHNWIIENIRFCYLFFMLLSEYWEAWTAVNKCSKRCTLVK